jgi:hypothetical protein
MKYILLDYVHEPGWPQLTRDECALASTNPWIFCNGRFIKRTIKCAVSRGSVFITG